VAEGKARELAAPAQRQWQPADEGENRVTAVLAAIVATVRAVPDAVARMYSSWFSKDILERHLSEQ